ncbi:MAG: hypothetical protein KC516_01610 [Nanoarchaeota archaeon]|nr:hypothetical protein [Nanoarchaeota archaeon]
MDRRVISGGLISLLGLILIWIPEITRIKEALFIWIYGIPIFIIGIIILFNKKEDKIEQINYKGGKK